MAVPAVLQRAVNTRTRSIGIRFGGKLRLTDAKIWMLVVAAHVNLRHSHIISSVTQASTTLLELEL